LAKKKTARKRKAPAKARKNSRNSAQKQDRKKQELPAVPMILAAIGVVIVVAGVLLLLAGRDRYPVQASYQEAINALRARNVSEVVLPDMAADFVSGNYTLRQLGKKYPGFEEDIKAADQILREEENEIVATVNGETISRADLEGQIALLPQQYRQLMSDEMVLQQMIDEKLLLQEATRQGIAPDAAEIEAAYQNLLVQGNLTEAQLAENLATYGLDTDAVRQMLARQLTVQMLLNRTVDSQLNVTPAMARAFYDAHRDAFMTGEQVTVRHILIPVTNGTDDAAAKATAEEALRKYEAGEDFCALVKEYSKDVGSQATCGEYTFGRGAMVPEFENASFALKPGETTIVKTVFGYHVILKMNETAPKQVPFDQVATSLGDQLRSQQRLDIYQAYIQGLRDNATIENKLAANATQSPAQASPQTPSEEQTEPAGADVSGAEDGAQNGTPTLVKAEPVNVSVTPTAEEPAAPTQPTESFTACLAEKGAVLYVSDVNPTSMDEAAKLGPGADKVVVDCSGDDAKCAAAGGFYPTWVIDGEQVARSLSVEELAQRTGCTL